MSSARLTNARLICSDKSALTRTWSCMQMSIVQNNSRWELTSHAEAELPMERHWHLNSWTGGGTAEYAPCVLRLPTSEGDKLPPIGFAGAITLHRAWRDVMIPAFDILILCCSMAILIVRLVKFINKAYAPISKNQCTSLKCPFSCYWILVNCCSETNSRGSFSSCIYRSVYCFLHIPKRWKII